MNDPVTRGRERLNSPSFSTSSTLCAELAPGDIGSLRAGSVRIAAFWSLHRHSGLSPNPRASVLDEIRRLADSRGWSHRTMMKRRNEALASEIALHDNGETQLDRWQQLCIEVGVAKADEIPKSITACKRVCFGDRGISRAHLLYCG
jgi:hypothetical protein